MIWLASWCSSSPRPATRKSRRRREADLSLTGRRQDTDQRFNRVAAAALHPPFAGDLLDRSSIDRRPDGGSLHQRRTSRASSGTSSTARRAPGRDTDPAAPIPSASAGFAGRAALDAFVRRRSRGRRSRLSDSSSMNILDNDGAAFDQTILGRVVQHHPLTTGTPLREPHPRHGFPVPRVRSEPRRCRPSRTRR